MPEMYLAIWIGRRLGALDARDRAAVSSVCLEPGLPEQVAREHTRHHLQRGLCGRGGTSGIQPSMLGDRRRSPPRQRHSVYYELGFVPPPPKGRHVEY